MPKLKNTILLFAILLCLILQYKPAWPESFPQSHWLQYRSPEEAGWSSDELENIRLEADKIGSAAVMAVYKGYVLFAWGDVSRPYKCHSVRKSLLSALIGIYVDRGQMRLDKTIAELGIDDISPLSDKEKESTVGDMLKARSGIFHPAAK
jgi:CubicO group peptidase (beta-lactamase class C family)